MNDPRRGTGRTTRLLQAVPTGGAFVCRCHTAIEGVVDMCNRIGRSDIRVLSPSYYDYRCIGDPITHATLDHDIVMTDRQLENYWVSQHSAKKTSCQ